VVASRAGSGGDDSSAMDAVAARCLRAGLVAAGCAVALVAVGVLMVAKP